MPDPYPHADFLAGGGEMGERMRTYDWQRTPLGPPHAWPRSLKTAVRIMLTSRQPFWLGWGPELTYLYNDAYKSIIGGKHPEALGRPFSEVWREIWDVVGPMAEQVMSRDEGTYVEAQRLIMERHGYPEETYYTFSYSPVPDDEGGRGGLICANTDDTRRVIGERQLALLREIAATAGNARTWRDACSLAMLAIETNARDLPFALLYVDDAVTGTPVLAASTPGAQALSDAERWPLATVLRSDESQVVEIGATPGVPHGDWDRAPSRAAIVPVAPSGTTGRAGALVVGLSPYRQSDPAYPGFLELVAGQISAALANAQAYEEERRRAEALAELDRAKTTFFSNVSHEFRTPLTLMLSPLEDLLSGDTLIDPPVRATLEAAHRNGQRLLKLVNALLDFARIEAGRTQGSFEPTALGAFTAELASNFRSLCERAGLTLQVECEDEGELAFVDRDMWEKIVLNLLSNAFKFTLRGGIAVRLQREETTFELTVSDTGAGIPPEALPRMFERFNRVEGSSGRSHEGTGIGLALVQELVKLHGGTIRVESEPGRGSVFTVSVPRGSAHVTARMLRSDARAAGPARFSNAFVDEAQGWFPAAAGETAPREGERARIVLADDNADLREYARRLLAQDYDVVAVADGAQALQAIRDERPDLVVSDVMMPRMDGFELVRAIREDRELRTLPVVMLSARAGEEARIEGLDRGADDYLPKPFSSRELLVRVATMLRSQEMRRRYAEEREASMREADQRKDEFIATLSHELRNPLAPLRNALFMMRLGKSPESSAKMIDMMDRQVTHLVRLVDDLLEMSRISRGTLELRRERVELVGIVRNAIETSTPLIEESGHRLAVSMPEETLWLEGDPVRLAQVLSNLLNNAAKYTPAGGRIEVDAWREGDTIAVAVRDNGPGIEPTLLPRLFEMFTRGSHEASIAQSGLGIGLALSRRLAQMHEGTLQAGNRPGRSGAEFVLRLPLARLEAAPREAIPPAAAAKLRSRRVLIVDDNRDGADTLASVLSHLGADTRVAHDGANALDAFRRDPSQVVLLDIGMPGMNGYEVARALRELPGGADAKIVALTGWGQDEDRQRARSAGFDHHLVKPVDITALAGMLRSFESSEETDSVA